MEHTSGRRGISVNALLHGNTVRMIVRFGGVVIDLCDDYNNMASAEMWKNATYGYSAMFRVVPQSEIKDFNAEWERCREGRG